jgi:CBS domain-containing protein
MTEKIARRGIKVPSEYAADYLEQVSVSSVCSRDVASLQTTQTLAEVRRWLADDTADTQHRSYPVIDEKGHVKGMLPRRTLLDPQWHYTLSLAELLQGPPIAVNESHSLRDAADHMVAENVGRLVVVSKDDPRKLVGIITRGDILKSHTQRLREARFKARHIKLGKSAKPTPVA